MTGIKIDEINANIIRKLLKDSRTSFTELAKENNITVAAAINRYKNLKKTGLIKGAIMQINPYYFGLNVIGDLGLSVKPEKIKEVKEFLDKEPCILSTWYRLEEINMGSFFATPKLEDFNAFITKLKGNPYIKNVKTLIHVGFLVNDYPENLRIKTDINVEQPNSKEKKPIPSNLHNKTFVETLEMEQMSQVDRTIAKILSEDARTSFRYIAKKLKLSTSNIIKRYQILRKKNVFLRSTISIDLRKLGYKARVMVYFNIKSGIDASELQKSLLNIPNLIVLVKTIGKTDMFAILPIATIEEFFKLKAIFHSIKAIEVIQIKLRPLSHQWPHNFFAHIL